MAASPEARAPVHEWLRLKSEAKIIWSEHEPAVSIIAEIERGLTSIVHAYLSAWSL